MKSVRLLGWGLIECRFEKQVFVLEVYSFPCFLDVTGKAADYHMLIRMIEEIKVSHDQFRCDFFVAPLYVAKVFSESVA